MTANRLPYLLALAIATTSAGCGSSRLFSRFDKDSDDLPTNHTEHDIAADETETVDELRQLWGDGGEAAPNQHATSGMTLEPVLPVSEHLARAERAVAEQRLTTARRHLDAIVGQQPAHPRAHHLLAVVSDLEGRFGDAEHHYQAALQSDRNNAAIVGDLGYSYLMQGRDILAEQYLLQARSLDPGHESAAQNLALLYSRRGDLAGARHALSEVLPPHEVQQTLAQLFPGLPPQSLQATPQLASAPRPRELPHSPPLQDPFESHSGAQRTGVVQNSAPRAGAVPHQSAMVGTQEFSSALPNAAPPRANVPVGGDVANLPYGPNAYNPELTPPPEIAQTSGEAPLPPSGGPIPSKRRWPPSTWPPATGLAPATGEQPHSPPARTTSGVTYLMQRRAAATQQNAAQTASSGSHTPPVRPVSESNAAASRSMPHNGMLPQSSGAGSSQIVVRPNMNGQSVDPGAAPTSAGTGQTGYSSSTQQNVMRSSPGTATGWNGAVYPPPQRQLPGYAPETNVDRYPPQGAPVQAGVPAGASAPPSATALPSPHAGFVLAPNQPQPANPLAGYEEDRRRFDQQFQQQVDQSYAQSPSGYISSPSASMPTPVHELPTWQPQSGDGAPLSGNGTPWSGQPADSPTRSPQSAYPQQGPYTGPAVRPATTPMGAANTPQAPPYYRQQQPTPAPTYGYGYGYGPSIRPAP